MWLLRLPGSGGPEPGELRRVARVYVWGRWFVWALATFAWLYPLNVDEVVYAPNAALAMLLLATNDTCTTGSPRKGPCPGGGCLR